MAESADGKEKVGAGIYRNTEIGDLLCDTLEEMVSAGKLTEDLAHIVLQQFDASFLDALQHVSAKAIIRADLKTYRFYDNVWQFELLNVCLRLCQGVQMQNTEVMCEKAKVVCVDSKLLDPKGGAES